MATQSPLSSANIAPALEAGLKTPVIGRTNEQLQTELDAAENAATALEERYKNPNWFNVAAGFFKPQLGGFTASLGSASQALGENLEQQRANVVPTYVARAQVGAYKGQMANRKTAADEFSAAQAAGFPPEKLDKLQARLSSLGATDLADSVEKMVKSQQAQATLTIENQKAIRDRVQSGLLSPEKGQELIENASLLGGKKLSSEKEPPVANAVLPQPNTASSAWSTSPGGEPIPPSTIKTENLPPVGEKKQEPITIMSPLGRHTAMPETMRIAQAEAREKDANQRLKDMALSGGEPETYNPIKRVLDSQISLLTEPANKKVVNTVMSALKQGTLASQLQTMLQEGMGFNVQGISGNIHFPVSKIVGAGWSKAEREVADELATNFAKMALIQQRIGNVNPNTARNAELGLYSDLTPNMNTNTNAALKSMYHMLADLNATKAQYDFANKVYRDENPLVKVAPGTPDKLSAILNHPSFSQVYEPYVKEHADIQKEYQKRITLRGMAKKD